LGPLSQMTAPEIQFERELEVFRTEAEAGTQFFYAYLAVHSVAADHEPVSKLLNRTPLFWNTCLGALQTASFVALGRVFDQDSAHNVNKLLRVAQDNPQIFSKVALGRRKQGNDPEPPLWLDENLRDAYEPTPRDFRRIRGHVRKRRKTYESKYKELRDKVFAHRAVSNDAESAELFGKTNIRELQRMFAFLGSLYEALWQLFFNGRKPVLQPLRYSVERMRDLPSPAMRHRSVQEKITHEAEVLLCDLSATRQRIPKEAR
jgi:hypothetical protein